MSSRSRSNKGSNAGGCDYGAVGGVRLVVTDDTVEPEATFPGRSCRVCRADDTDEMVRCDKCLKWYHFVCVGVTQAIENEPWSCAYCANPNNVTVGLEPPLLGGAKSNAADRDKLNLLIHQESSGLPTPKTSKASRGESKKNTASKGKSHTADLPPSDDRYLKGVSGPNEIASHSLKGNGKLPPKGCNQVLPKEAITELGKATSVASHVSSRASSRSSQALVKLKLQKLEEERILNAKKLEQERTYLEDKYRLLEELASEGGFDANSVSDVISEWRPRAQSSHHSRQEDRRLATHESLDLGADC